MPRRPWTDEQRAEGLRLFTEVGPAEAGRRLGIPAGTIASWGHRAGVTSPEPKDLERATAARQASMAARKQALAEKFLDAAGKLVDLAIDDDDELGANDRRWLMAAAAAATDKLQVLTGGLTANVGIPEQPGPTPTEEEARAKRLATVRQIGMRLVGTEPVAS